MSETCCQVSASTIAGHAAVTCISEVFTREPSGGIGRYSRMPLVAGLRGISFIVRSDHAHPCVVSTPHRFQSLRIWYRDSPAKIRCIASATIGPVTDHQLAFLGTVPERHPAPCCSPSIGPTFLLSLRGRCVWVTSARRVPRLYST